MYYKLHRIFGVCGLLFLSICLFNGGVALAKTNSLKNGSAVATKQVKKVNINTANISSLSKIKGIGRKTAKAVVDYRKKNGKFKSLNDLLKIKCRTINKKWLARFSKFFVL